MLCFLIVSLWFSSEIMLLREEEDRVMVQVSPAQGGDMWCDQKYPNGYLFDTNPSLSTRWLDSNQATAFGRA